MTKFGEVASTNLKIKTNLLAPTETSISQGLNDLYGIAPS